jgi:hypothetical protein
MSDRLKRLIERARQHQMSPQELLEQEISFAYGNAHFENERITREMVERALPAPDDNPSADNEAG